MYSRSNFTVKCSSALRSFSRSPSLVRPDGMVSFARTISHNLSKRSESRAAAFVRSSEITSAIASYHRAVFGFRRWSKAKKIDTSFMSEIFGITPGFPQSVRIAATRLSCLLNAISNAFEATPGVEVLYRWFIAAVSFGVVCVVHRLACRTPTASALCRLVAPPQSNLSRPRDVVMLLVMHDSPPIVEEQIGYYH